MHPAVWLSWSLVVMTLALMTTNPLYLVLLLLCVVFVAILAPRTATAAAGLRTMAVAGAAILLLSVFVAAVNGSSGGHTLATIPAPDLPDWMGGLRLGGQVTAEALVAAITRGLAIACVFLAFAVLSGAVTPYRLVRLWPAPLFQAALLVTVGMTLLPATIEDFRRIREMRALRGASPGVRGLPAMLVPSIIGGLERAMRLAEALEARGYAAPGTPRLPARFTGLAAAPVALAAGWSWLYAPHVKWLALAGFGLSIGLAGVWVVMASGTRRPTRMAAEPFSWRDRVAAGLLLGAAAAAVASRALGWLDLGYNPFAGLAWPPLDLPVLVLLAVLILPGFHAAGGRAELRLPALPPEPDAVAEATP